MGGERQRVAIIGRGRLGTVLAAALREADVDVEGPLGRDALPTSCDVALLCVPDSAVASVAARLPRAMLVGHCAGALTLDVLAPHEALSIHPLMSVTSRGARFAGSACAVAANSTRAHELATSLATRLGMRAITIDDSRRALYHAAASLASNYLVALEGAAEGLAARAGVQRADLAPLVRAAVENWIALGARDALTGPVVRGDVATVQRQRAAIADADATLLPLWDALTDVASRLATEHPAT